MRVAAVDCGTNSLRLLVADVARPAPGEAREGRSDEAAGSAASALTVAPVERRGEIVRLGEGVAETGRLGEAALGRARATAGRYAARCRELRVERVAIAATAAARMASNGDELLGLLGEAFRPWGAVPRIVAGEEEARLSFAGALSGSPVDPGPYLVVDSGGGSTELARGRSAPEAALSVPLGCVTLHEALDWPDPPTAEDVAAALDVVTPQVAAALDRVGAAEARTLVALAGGATTLTAHTLRLPRYDSAAVDGARLTTAGLADAARDMIARPVAARAALPYLVPGREDVIGAASLIWLAIARECAARGIERVVTSERDILDGLAMSLA